MGYVYMKRLCYVLLICLLPMLGACAVPVYPRYQPIAEERFGTLPRQGYSDHQINERTYLVTYQGFNPAGTGSWGYLSHEEWMEMAHDYVLYRAAEIARNKGAKQFVILHRDDSNQSWLVSISGSRRHPSSGQAIRGFMPRAHVLIRLLSDDTAAIFGTEDHVHEVDKLLPELIERNVGLVKQQEPAASHKNVTASKSRFLRWRVPVLLDDSASIPSLTKLKNSLLETEITEGTQGVFRIVLWSRLPLSAIDLLRQGVKTADQEGYRVFKLVNWTTEEYRYGRHWNNWNDRNAWFRTKARLVLQQQDELNSLEPVFVVDEILKSVTR